MKLFIWLNLLVVILLLILPSEIVAKEQVNECDNRYVTLVNPVRARDLWIDKTINPLTSQYDLINQHQFPATWLLQHDVLEDKELLNEIKKFNNLQELGVFLEVSEKYANKSRVIYPHAVPWFSPQAVFLSAYSPTDRQKLIDKLFTDFKLEFGFYPRSIGAWWIDSYSLNYMKDKYGIKSTMIVADQKTTDNYGVWGQWWGMPYHPAKANILTPASNLNNKLDVVIIQWAQRDPLKAYGEGPEFSNYSLQANDYIRQGKNINYFNQLVNSYLDCNNPIGQITIGLETGIESVGYLDEYSNQLTSLKNKEGLNFVTMSQFADHFSKLVSFPTNYQVVFKNSVWKLTAENRLNDFLKDRVIYNPEISFSDYFIKDTNSFLNRQLPEITKQKEVYWFPWFILVNIGFLIFSYKKKMIMVWIISTLFSIAAFGLILKSFYQVGWKVYYGPVISSLRVYQILLIIIAYLVTYLISKWKIVKKCQIILWLLPLVFGIDFIIQAIRFSIFSGRQYLGFALDNLRFFGISFSKFNIYFINQDFPSVISSAFLKIDFNHFWKNPVLAIIIYPLIHILMAIILGLMLNKLSIRSKIIILLVLVFLFVLQINYIYNSDPRQVIPILLQ